MEEEEKNGEEPVKETVKRVFTKLEERGWISEVCTPLALHKITVPLIELPSTSVCFRKPSDLFPHTVILWNRNQYSDFSH